MQGLSELALVCTFGYSIDTPLPEERTSREDVKSAPRSWVWVGLGSRHGLHGLPTETKQDD